MRKAGPGDHEPGTVAGLAESNNMYLDENGAVVYDSIIENKSKIKSYWEQLMLAAELANQPQTTYKDQQGNSPAPSHNSDNSYTAQPPVPQTNGLEEHVIPPKLSETVVERDIRLQQEKELALITERQNALKTLGQAKEAESTPRRCSIEALPVASSIGETSVPSEDIRYGKETPIEQEIRLVRERDEELRRSRKLSSSSITPVVPNSVIPEEKKVASLAQRQWCEPSVQRVQNGVQLDASTNLSLKQPKSLTNVIPQNGSINKNNLDNESKSLNTEQFGGPPLKFYVQNPKQKGLMNRFLALRGKMGSSSCINLINSPLSSMIPPLKVPPTSPDSLHSEPFTSFTSLVQSKDREEPVNLGTRPGYISAEDKIQSELQEMRRREEELRQQRGWNMYSTHSQPDLLNLNTDLPPERQMRSLNGNINNSLVEVSDKPSASLKRRSALIEQWESRIQNKNTD